MAGLNIFGSESSTKDTGSASEQGFQLDDSNATAVSTGTIGAGKNSNINVAVPTVDAGAVQSAFDFANNALTGIDKATENALIYGAGATNAAFDFAGKTVDESIAAVESARIDALEFGAGAFNSALGAIEGARSDALTFGAGAFNTAADSINKTVAELNRTNLATTENALIFSAGALQESIGLVEGTGEDILAASQNAFDFSAGALVASLNASRDNTQAALKSLNETTSSTLASINSATRSDSAQNFERLTKLAAVAFVALAAAFVFVRR